MVTDAVTMAQARLNDGPATSDCRKILLRAEATLRARATAGTLVPAFDVTVPEEVKQIAGNEDSLRRLVDQLRSPAGVLPFVGAGLSVPLGFPGWGCFLLTLARAEGTEDRIGQLLDAGEYPRAAEELMAARGPFAFHADVENAYGDHKLDGKQITGAVKLLPDLCRGPVITTNFDHVLEKAFDQADRHFKYVVWGAKTDIAVKSFNRNWTLLLKIHGDVEDRDDRILTDNDYTRAYGDLDKGAMDPSLPLPTLIRTMLLNRPVLFVGCSLNQDRTVQVLEQVVREFKSVEHFAIVEQPSVEEEHRKRRRFLSDRNIHPVWYPEGRHDLVERLLAYLAQHARPR
jgi:hypothetical protein